MSTDKTHGYEGLWNSRIGLFNIGTDYLEICLNRHFHYRDIHVADFLGKKCLMFISGRRSFEAYQIIDDDHLLIEDRELEAPIHLFRIRGLNGEALIAGKQYKPEMSLVKSKKKTKLDKHVKPAIKIQSNQLRIVEDEDY